MKNKIEFVFGKTARGVMFAINPIKKIIIKTQCMAHKYINNKALCLLKYEGYNEQYRCYCKYILDINEGVTWADQDFKSTNHFYHFSKQRGLYGFSNALDECRKYYKTALRYLDLGDIRKSMFYMGAACHLVQDSTVPQHVNNKLLKKHRKFELWIIGKILMGYPFETKEGIKRYNSIDSYIKENAIIANNTYLRFNNISDKEERYMSIACNIIKEAQITTAGLMLDFYEKFREKISFD